MGGLLLRREVRAGVNPGTGFGFAGVSRCSRRGSTVFLYNPAMIQIWMRPLFKAGQYTPQWQHGFLKGVPGYIDQREQIHKVFARKVLVSRFRSLADNFTITPLVDAHRVDISTVMFELWGIERANPLDDIYQAQAWRVWLQDPATRPG